MARIRSIPFVVGPFADRAFIIIPPKNLSFNWIRNVTVMLWALSIRFQQIDSHFKIGTARILSYNRPAIFRPQFSYSPAPFRSIFCQIFQFLPCDFPADIIP